MEPEMEVFLYGSDVITQSKWTEFDPAEAEEEQQES